MKRKGFTLIELLAVIVILAIIALIAVPVVMNIITKANKSAFQDTAYGIIKAGELYYADQLLEPNGMESDASFEFPNNLGNLQIKGSLPTGGNMKVSKQGKVAIAISNGKYCIKKGYNDNDVSINEDIENCIIPSILSSTDICIKSNSICSNGTNVNVKVNASENYDFYVIKDTGRDLTLIMDRNIGSKEVWISETDYKLAGGTNWGSYGNNEKGPLTALKTLEQRTSGWTNLESFNYNLTDDNETNQYENLIRNNVKARLLTKTEMSGLGCKGGISRSCPPYLYTNTISAGLSNVYGYWLSTSANDEPSATALYHYGMWSFEDIRSDQTYSGEEIGIRPVIIVSKSS